VSEDSKSDSAHGRVALITGASRGIGKAVAIALGQQGFVVVGTATSEAGADNISTYLEANGIKGWGAVLNVREPEQILQVIAEVTSRESAPAILVNNAAITDDGLMLRMKESSWQAVMETNLNAVFHTSKAVLKGMSKLRWGRIINISSVVARMGNPGQANYCASKAGVEGFTRSLSMEMASRGITVNCVAPGFIETDMTAVLNEDQKKNILSNVPAGRLGRADEVASVVQFLASEGAAYVTGQTIAVNGGLYMA